MFVSKVLLCFKYNTSNFFLLWIIKHWQASDLWYGWIYNLPVNAQHSHNSHCGELVAHIHHHNRFTHKVSEDPLSVSDQLVNVERHHKQEQHVGYCQVQHVDVRYHFLLACFHSVDHQSVGYNSNRTQDAINGWKYVHESGDVDVAVRFWGWVGTCRVSKVQSLVVFAKYVRVVHLQILLIIASVVAVINARTRRWTAGVWSPNSPRAQLKSVPSWIPLTVGYVIRNRKM